MIRQRQFPQQQPRAAPLDVISEWSDRVEPAIWAICIGGPAKQRFAVSWF